MLHKRQSITEKEHRRSQKFIKTRQKSIKTRKHSKQKSKHDDIIRIIEKIFARFRVFKDAVEDETNQSVLKKTFIKKMCQNKLFKVHRTKCAMGGYKIVLICQSSDIECNYVYAFDFKSRIDEDGDDRFSATGSDKVLHKYDNVLGISPVYFQTSYCGYRDLQRVDFMILYNNGIELFDFLYINSKSHKKYKSSTNHNMWLSLIYLLTTIYSLSLLHTNGYVHRDLKPENILLGNHHNSKRDFMTIADYGFVTHESEDISNILGTSEYLTPKISRIYKGFEEWNMVFTDLLEHDLHTIGYTTIEILLGDLFNKQLSKKECSVIETYCGVESVSILNKGKNKDRYCYVDDAITYLACHQNLDGSIGKKDDILKLKQKKSDNPVPESIVNMMKDISIDLADYGFKKSINKSEEGKQILDKLFNKMVSDLKKNKKDYKIMMDTLTDKNLQVKLNPEILNKLK